MEGGHGERPGALDDQLRLFDEGDDGVRDRVVMDRDHPVHEAFDEAESSVRRAGDGDAVGDRAGGDRAGGVVVGERLADAIHGNRLHAGDAHLGASGLDRAGDPPKQATAARGHQHFAHLRALFENLETDGALPGDHGVVIEGRDVDAALADGEGHGLGARFFQGSPGEDHPGPILAAGRDLGEGRRRWHDHDHADPAAAAGEGDALRVVASAGGDQPSGDARGVQVVDEVGGAANFEGACQLHLFALEEHGDAHLGGEGGGRPHGREPHGASNRLSGGDDPFEGDVAGELGDGRGFARHLSPPPDFSAIPTVGADACGAVGDNPAVVKGVHPRGEVKLAEVSLAERTFVPGVGAALFDPTESSAIPLCDTGAIDQVGIEVVLFYATGLARADRLVAFGEVGMGRAEVPPAVLAGVLGRVWAVGKPATKLADRRTHRPSLLH